MSSNKNARKALEKLYGKECFIDKLHLRKDKQKYTGKSQYKKMKQLSYHHIVMKKDGGKATVENGALLSIENHAWFHKQTPERQKAMNEAFQAYKISVAEINSCGVVQAQIIENNIEDYISIPLEDNSKLFTRETTKQRRAREKRELREALEELEYE